MLKEFMFEKSGYNFRLRNPRLDEYGKLKLEWKVDGEVENARSKEGYFFSGKLDKTNKAILCYNLKLNGKELAGVRPPEEIYSELLQIDMQLREKREQLIDTIINEILNGKRPIDFSIVGCDWPHYQAWLKELPKDLNGLEQSIMARAITRYSGEKFISSSCNYLEGKLNSGITTIDEIRKDAFNLQFDKKVQEYHGFKEKVVTNFQIKLSNLISKEYIEKLRAKEEKEQKAKKEKEERRNSLKMEIIEQGKERGSDGTDFYALVKLIEPSTGESLKFNCRNLFDVGYVINPDYEISKGIEGGIVSNGMWQDFEDGKGWYDVRELTEFEKKCFAYLREFSPISTGIRL